MNRLRSKVLSLLLVLALVFTSTGMVFGTEEVSVNEGAAGAEDVIEQTAAVEGKRLNASEDFTHKTAINAVTMFNSATAKKSSKYTVQANSGIVIPVVAKNTGMMYLDAKNVGDPSEYVSVYLCETYNGAVAADGYFYYKEWHYLSGNESETGGSAMPVTKGKTYYIAIESASYNEYPSTITVTPYVYTTEDRTLSIGTSKWTIASGYDGDGTTSEIWYKIKPNKTGQMTLKLTEFSSTYGSYGKVRLYNSKKKAISDEVYCSSDSGSSKTYFGVKKGTTYYLKVTNCSGNNQQKYGINYSVKKKTDRNLSAKKKAKNLKRKAKATESLFVASTKSSTDWYKIRVTSKRKTVLTVNTAGIESGKLTITVYRGSKRLGKQVIYPYEDSNDFMLTYGTKGKANAGTYHIKVTKNTRASGSYKIRYKQ